MPTLYEKVDRFLARQLGQLDARVDVMVKRGVDKDTASSIAKARLVNLVTANANFMGIRPSAPEYDYAVARASALAAGVVDWGYDPEHVMPPVVVESFAESKRLGVASKSISGKIGRGLGVGAEAVGETIGRGARRAGEIARKIGEYI